jgi:ABC-type branched-subunit amino acid transport system ATPase component/predicted MFS family arabinose efflux permease
VTETLATPLHDGRQDIDAPRPLVPSVREVAAGAALPTPAPLAREEHGAIGASLVASLRALRPAALGGRATVIPLVMLAYFSLVQQLDYQAVNLMLPEIARGLGTATAGLFASLGFIALCQQFASPVMGYVADRVRRTTLVAVGAVVSHGAIALSGFAPGLGTFIGTRVLSAGGDLVRAPVGLSLLADIAPPSQRGRLVTIVGIGAAAGAIVGPLVAGLVATAVGWRATLVVLGGIAAVCSLAFFLLREPVRGAQDRLAAGASTEDALQEQRPVTWSEAWRAAWSIRTLRHFAWALPFLTVGTVGVALLTPLLYANRFHLAPVGRGLVLGLTGIAGVAGLVFSGPLSDRVLAYRPGRVLTMLAGVICLQAAGIAVLAFAPNLSVAVPLNLVPAFFGALISPASLTVTTLVVPARIRGLGVQVTAPFAAIGLPLPVYLATSLGAGDVTRPLLIVAGILVIGAVFVGTAAGGAEQDIRAAIAASLAEREFRTARERGDTRLLVCRDVDVTYSGTRVLFGVDLDLREGEILALLGTNGAGKSTLLLAILGLQQASNGAIFFDGDDITHLPPEDITRRGIILLPGGQAVFPSLSVAENFAMAASMVPGRSTGETAQIRGRLLDMFPQLRDRWHTRAGDLSGGEQQMVGLSQALLMRPRLLAVDELALGLAAPIVERLLQTLREINRAGTTIVIVEQSINVALQIATRAVFMEKGQVRYDGPVDELVARPDVVRSVFLAGAAATGGLGRDPERERALRSHELLLSVEDVSLGYGGVEVLRDMAIRVRSGEVVGIVGPNGAGKTSLFDVITGFARPSGGAVRFAGRDVTTLSPAARARLGISRSYQNVRLFPALTVRENIAVALERHLSPPNPLTAAVWSPGTRRAERNLARRIDNLVESLGLVAYGNKFLAELSTGTRRIVDIACQLAAQPLLLLLDEPSSGLAQAESEMLGPVIGRIVKETGCAVLVIEHDLGLVSAVSDRLVAMQLGSLLAEGAPRDVLADPRVTSAILGAASDAVVSRSISLTAATT